MKFYEMPGELILLNDAPSPKLDGWQMRFYVAGRKHFLVLAGPEHSISVHDDYCEVSERQTGSILGEFKTFEEARAACVRDEVHHAD